MIFRISFLFCFLFCFQAISSQVLNGSWESENPDVGLNYHFNSVKVIHGDGYIMVGTKPVNTPVRKNVVYVMRLDSHFEVMWSRIIEGEGNYYGNAVHSAYNGNFIITGTSESLDGDDSKIFLIKLDSSGETEWLRIIEQNGKQEGNDIKSTPDGGFIVVGSTNDEEDDTDMYVVKLDAQGNIQWDKTIKGEDEEVATSVAVTNDGGYVIGGYTAYDHGYRRIHPFIFKLDEEGNMIWNRIINEVFFGDVAELIMVDDDIVVVGNEAGEGFLSKLNEQGEVEWFNFYRRTSRASKFYSVTRAKNGDLYALGQESAVFYVIRSGINGDYKGGGIYFEQDIYDGYSIAGTDNGGIIMVGGKTGRSTGSGRKAFILKAQPTLHSCFESTLGSNHEAQNFNGIISEVTIHSGTGVSESLGLTSSDGPGLINHCITLGVEDKNFDSGIKLYPNPTDGLFHIESNSLIMEITVYNSIGQKVYFYDEPLNAKTISLNQVEAGVYFVKIHTETGAFTKKLIVSPM